MESEKLVLVPQDRIDRLEQSRKDLIRFLTDLGIEYAAYSHITEPMWYITHRKFKEVK